MIEDLKEKFIAAIDPFTKINILLHIFPDPDCLGAALGLKKLIRTLYPNMEVRIYGQTPTRLQNKAVVKVLDIPLLNPKDIVLQDKIGNIFVDFNPLSTNHEWGNVSHTWCIDHHSEKGINDIINCDYRPVGSACTIVFDYLTSFGVSFDKESTDDCNTATAMFYGIKTDTKDLIRDATSLDDEAYIKLREYYDVDKLNTILKTKLPPSYFDKVHTSYEKKELIGPIMIVNAGFLNESQSGIVSQIADFYIERQGIDVLISFGVITDLSEIIASIRVDSHNYDAVDLVKGLFGSGGGHPSSAATQRKLDLFDPKNIPELEQPKFLELLMSVLKRKICFLMDIKE